MRNKIGNTSCTVPVKPIGIGFDSQLSILLLCSSPFYKKFSNKIIEHNKKIVSVLESQVDALYNTYRNCEIVIITNDEIKNRPKRCRFVENQLANETGEVEQIRLGLKNIQNENCLIISGNVCYPKNTVTNIVKTESSILYSTNSTFPIGIRIDDSYTEIISYSIPENSWCEAAFFANNEFKELVNFAQDKQNSRLFAFEAVNHIIEKNGKFKSIKDKSDVLYRI